MENKSSEVYAYAESMKRLLDDVVLADVRRPFQDDDQDVSLGLVRLTGSVVALGMMAAELIGVSEATFQLAKVDPSQDLLTVFVDAVKNDVLDTHRKVPPPIRLLTFLAAEDIRRVMRHGS